MAEAVDAVPLDVGDRADAREVEIARDHRDRQRRAGHERSIPLLADDPLGAPPPAIGAMPSGRSRSLRRPRARGTEPDAASGVTIGVIPPAPPPETGSATNTATTAHSPRHRRAPQPAVEPAVAPRRTVSPARSFDSAAIRRSLDRTYWIICENGVTPAIGSLANSQANATAPSSLPSM